MDKHAYFVRIGRLWAKAAHDGLRNDVNKVARVFEDGDVTVGRVVNARQRYRVRVDTDRQLTGKAVAAMLELDRATEEILQELNGADTDRPWGFEWVDKDGRVVCSADGEHTRRRIAEGLLTPTGRLKVRVCRELK